MCIIKRYQNNNQFTLNSNKTMLLFVFCDNIDRILNLRLGFIFNLDLGIFKNTGQFRQKKINRYCYSSTSIHTAVPVVFYLHCLHETALAHWCKCVCTMSRNARRLTGLLRSAGRICLPSTCSLNLRRASSSVALCPALPSFPSTRPRSRASKCPEQDTGERGNQQKNTSFECLLTNEW